MTRDEESQIREIFRKHIEKATAQIAELDIDCGYFPQGFSGRFAEIMTQTVALMAETSQTAETESR